VPGDWLREERPELAVERILDAADEVFAKLGVSAAGMAEIAEAAGCSRGTLYRYFRSRHELHLAYVERAGLAIARRVRAEIADIEDPRERVVEYVLCALREVRGNPGTAAWFAPGAAGVAARMSRSAQVVEALAAAFGTPPIGSPRRRAERRLRARWLARVVVSLLADPGESDAEERALVERFVAPALAASSVDVAPTAST
jgi:AcrR family transcriptional regulator